MSATDRPPTPFRPEDPFADDAPAPRESHATPPDPEHDPLLADLTEPQRQAVLHTEGPLLILAAAGSGKTRTLTRRIGHLVRSGIPPWSILALTFTNKAAGEMRERVQALLGGPESRGVRGLTVTTFHSLCARLLRRYAELAKLPGLKPDYSIYDTSDQTALMKKVLESLALASTNWPPRSVLGAISGAKNELLDADAYAAQATDFYSKTIAKAYSAYERGLRSANAVDFDDLLLLTARMLKESAEVRAECQRRWQYLLIDEYQDTNRAQFVIAAMLAGGTATQKPNICVVGDPDQAIYGWRGADISNILDFETQYPGARVVTLGENFRSTAPILALADTLIKNNEKRKDKALFTRRKGGERVEVVSCYDERHESSLVVDWLRARHDATGEGKTASAGTPWRDMAVFYRTNSLSRVMEDALRTAGIPYSIARGTAFFDREEVKSAVAYLRVVANPADDVSLDRILNTPARGISDATSRIVEVYAGQRQIPMFAALRQIAEGARVDGISPRAAASISKFVAMVDGWTGRGSFWGDRHESSDAGMTLHALTERVIKESGLEKMYADRAKTSGSEADEERLDNLDEVINSARQFELEYDPSGDAALDPREGTPNVPPLLAMLRGYLESISLVADADAIDPAQGAVTLMTLHAAKGLEFDAVAMIGLDEGLLPHSRARESDAALEEERRLCFVGITRAMQRLLITSSKYRTVRGLTERQIPSRFLEELATTATREFISVSDQSDSGNPDAAWIGESDEHDRDMALRRGVPPSLLDATRAAASARAAAGAGARFPVGAMVRHPQFGVGKVLSVQGGVNARASIQFRDVGVKTLVLEYARLERVGS
jgi:DNA helicase-2/ATP-dependent DNA helicase PcrA